MASISRIAIIGYGEIGRRHHMNLKALGAEILTCDHNPMIHADVQTLEEILSRQVDGIVIATPPATHLSLAQHVLQVGLPLLIEKPLGLPEEKLAWQELLHSTQIPVLVGYNWRFEASLQRLVFTPWTVWNCWYGQEPANRHSTWVWNPAQGGGALLHYSHALDLLLWFSSPHPVAVRTLALTPNEDHARIEFHYQAGSRAFLELSLSGKWPITILAMTNQVETSILWHRQSVVDFNAMYYAEARHFLDCIRDGAPSRLSPAWPNGAVLLEWITAIRQSAGAGGRWIGI